MARWNRTNFFSKFDVDSVLECDLILNNWEKFKIKRPTTFYKVIEDDCGAMPRILSLKLYGRVDWWFVIGKINGIEDWFNDLIPNQVLIVPDQLDISDWYMQIRGI